MRISSPAAGCSVSGRSGECPSAKGHDSPVAREQVGEIQRLGEGGLEAVGQGLQRFFVTLDFGG